MMVSASQLPYPLPVRRPTAVHGSPLFIVHYLFLLPPSIMMWCPRINRPMPCSGLARLKTNVTLGQLIYEAQPYQRQVRTATYTFAIMWRR